MATTTYNHAFMQKIVMSQYWTKKCRNSSNQWRSSHISEEGKEILQMAGKEDAELSNKRVGCNWGNSKNYGISFEQKMLVSKQF